MDESICKIMTDLSPRENARPDGGYDQLCNGAEAETTTIPIVMPATWAPRMGLIARLVRPGNVTGVAWFEGSKELDLLKEIVPFEAHGSHRL